MDLWLWRFAEETLSRLTFGPSYDLHGIWTSDGREVVFASSRDTGHPAAADADLYRKTLDGGKVDRLERGASGIGARFPVSMSPDDKLLVFRSGEIGQSDLAILPLANPAEERLLIDSDGDQHDEVSPDGQWLAYTSDESGRREIYVQRFPDIDRRRWQVSTDGGESVAWSRSGEEIFFRVSSVPARMMVARFQTDAAGARPGAPVLLFEGDHLFGERGRNYAVSPDGQRFLMIKEAETEEKADAGPDIVVVVNFDEELRRLVPVE